MKYDNRNLFEIENERLREENKNLDNNARFFIIVSGLEFIVIACFVLAG